MNTSLLKKLAATLLAAGTVFTTRAALKVGDSLPDLTQFKLQGPLPASLKGKVVLLDFWASWCLPCAKSFPALDALHKQFGDRLVIIAVNVDEKKSNMDSFLKKHPADFIVVRDAAQKLVAAAGPETMPTSFILDGAGKVRFLHNGFHGESTHEEYVKEIKSLLK